MISISALAFSTLTSLSATQSPESKLVISPCDAGERQQFDVVDCEIELKNIGDKPIKVAHGEAALPWDKISQDTIVVPPHGVAYIKATVALRDSAGFIKRSFRFQTDEPGILAQRGSSVYAFVSTVLDSAAPTIDFGLAKLDETQQSKSIALNSREVKDFRILGVLSKPDYLDVSLGQDGKTISAVLKQEAPWGLLHDKIKVKINAPQQSEAWVTVDANALGDVVPDGNPYALGLMRTNHANEFLLRLSSRSGKDFEVGRLTAEGFKADAKAIPCSPAKEGCKLIKLVVANDQPLGRVLGTLKVELPDRKRVLPVEVVGMLLKPETKIHDFNEEIEKSRQAKGQAQSEVAQNQKKGIDLAQTLKQAASKSPEAFVPPGAGPLLRWSVANQGTIYGYLIYRADSESGPFLRVNKDIVKVVDDDSAGSYQWRDTSAESGKTYWYSVGTVTTKGEKQSLTGAQKIIAK